MVSGRLSLAVCLMLSAASVGADPEQQGISWNGNPFSICSTNFESHADMSLAECKSACMSSRMCDEFSFPLMDAKAGCRLAKSGGCSPQAIDNEGYITYKKTLVADEDPDYEGPGQRRRRRSDSRRRTHNAERTSVSEAIGQVSSIVKKQAAAVEQAQEAVAKGEGEASLYAKEVEAKKDMKKKETDWQVQQDIENQEEGGAAAQGKAAVSSAKQQLENVKSALHSLKSQQAVYRRAAQNSELTIEMTTAQQTEVGAQIVHAEGAIEQLMQDPGRLADQDRQIGIAILGKLRVARALLQGHLAPLDQEQHKVDWVVNLKEAMLKAIRNPSPTNLADAKRAYATAASMREQEKLNEQGKEDKEAAELAQEEQDAKDESDRQAEADEKSNETAKEEAELATAKRQAAADEAAQAQNPDAMGVVEAPPVEPVEPVTGPEPKIVKIARGFYDPPVEERL